MKIGFIGNDQMLISCLEIASKTANIEVSFVIFDSRRNNLMNPLDKYCQQKNFDYKSIEKLNTPEMLAYIKSFEIDYLLSINNFWVIRPAFIKTPSKATINFHNSIPSKYHGLNIPSWVIFNNEKTHGSMWHFVEEGIDTGNVILFREFNLNAKETAASLMVKCIKSGIEMFGDLLEMILNKSISSIPQEVGASYFGSKDYPENLGYIDLNQNAETIDRIVRSLNYGPYPNNYLFAKLKFNEKEIILNSVEIEEYKIIGEVGSIVKIDEENFCIQCSDAIINLSEAMDKDFNYLEGNEIAEYFNLGVNQNILSHANT